MLPASGQSVNISRLPGVFIILYIVFFVLVASAIVNLPVSRPESILILLLIMFYAQFIFRKSLLKIHSRAIKKIVFTELGWCYLQQKNGAVAKADILADSIVTEYLVILNLKLKSDRKKYFSIFQFESLLLTSSMMGAQQFRQLKSYLRISHFS